MNVLGISAYFHDAAAALVVDGQLIAAAQEERFTRVKHDSSTPVHAVAFCLETAGLTIDDIDHVVFYEKPLRKFERLLTHQLRIFPRGLGQFVSAMGTWLSKRLWLQSDLAEALGCDPERVCFSEHHLSHAAASFFSSPFDSAAVLTLDGVGEWATAAIHHGVSDSDGCRLELVEELHFPDSIGLLYSAITAYLGFEVNNGEYKVMGLASYGTPRYVDVMEKVCAIRDDGTLTLDMDVFCFDRDPQRSFTPALEDLLGPARVPGSPMTLPAVDEADQRFADIAASLQAHCERYVFAAAKRAQAKTGETNLCLDGGVALNSVANAKLAKDGPFEALYVQPAAGDAGGALGAALYVAHVVLGEPRGGALKTPFLGQGYGQDEVEGFLTDTRIRHRVFEDEAALNRHVASRLADGEVGGLFSGRFEWGPRALGNRSIIADPRREDTRERVNRSVKFREPFRPFAPAVLADEAATWFQVSTTRPDFLTDHMLSVVPVTDAGREALGAVTHVDGTARVQTVSEASSPRLHGVLEAFREETGMGVLLNTSMNLKGEPMCASPADAYATFARSGLDFLVMERCLVERAA